MRILFIGDIVGRPGRQLVKTGLSALVSRHEIDFVVANAENAGAGFGITREIGDEFLTGFEAVEKIDRTENTEKMAEPKKGTA